jgi:hypothetical protein
MINENQYIYIGFPTESDLQNLIKNENFITTIGQMRPLNQLNKNRKNISLKILEIPHNIKETDIRKVLQEFEIGIIKQIKPQSVCKI